MPNDLSSQLKDEAKEAALRIATTQAIKAAKVGLLKALCSRGVNNKYIEAFSSFLDTELGGAFLSVVAGSAVDYIPGF